MNILRLKLSRPLAYRAAPMARAPLAPASESSPGTLEAFLAHGESFDRVLVFALADVLIPSKDDGPHAAWPPARVLFNGSRLEGEAAPPGSGGRAEGGPGTAGTLGAEPAGFSIGLGECAFAQFPLDRDLGHCLEDFLREAWWRGIELEGPLVLRRIEEDGRASLQWICPAAFPPPR
jgi:hypothetical protein